MCKPLLAPCASTATVSGYGLDAKAIQAVQQWRFPPALKDGKPANVQISVEVGFHLY